MKSQRILFVFCTALAALVAASAQNPAAAPLGQIQVAASEPKKPVVIPDEKLTDDGRMNLIRGLTAELGYARKPFPMGKEGLTVDAKTGAVTPDDQKIEMITAGYGPSLKPGDRARITDLKFEKKSIVIEINGGPVKKKKWWEHVQISGSGGTMQPGQPADNANIRGTLVELKFEKFVPNLKPAEVKQLLDPVLNFSAKSVTEAYLDTIPPLAKEAIKDHRVLVGMNREMVTYAKGRPPQKHRERDGDVDYEEWIYGTPPQVVEFIRFVGDEVVRVELMKVDGTKEVRTDREVVLNKERPEVAQTPAQPTGEPTPSATTSSDDGPKTRPTLKRPGEETQQPEPSGTPNHVPPTGPTNVPGPTGPGL